MPTDDLNVAGIISLDSPQQTKYQRPISNKAGHTVVEGRDIIKRILSGIDHRLLVAVGPCSIHDPKAALDYAKKLNELRIQIDDRIYPVMRVYFEKPRTTVGWKGLINDPHLDGSFDIEAGLLLARSILLDINEMGLPVATEMLEPIIPQYIADLIAWTAIGARTIESQTHRQMASGLSMPVGYKNSTNGNLQIAIDAMASARSQHSFLGIDEGGRTAIIKTAGNPWGHIILRGGTSGPNYDPDSVAKARQALTKANLNTTIVIDCSHANSNKDYHNQEIVWNSILEQRATGDYSIVGAMIESNIHEGNQPLYPDLSKLQYGVSITDACVSWEETEQFLRKGYESLGA